jgi:hypothetical protein
MKIKTKETPIKIDKNIPAPIPAIKRFPFEKMNVGDSFLLPGNESNVTLRTNAYLYGKFNNKKFVVKESEGTYRCWRIK